MPPTDLDSPELTPALPNQSKSSSHSGANPAAARLLAALFVGSGVFRFLIAWLMTKFTLVDDAYIHLRYARNLAEQGAFVYNPGEAVFGLTSPLFGLVAACLYFVFGSHIEVAVIVFNILLWSAAGVLIAKELPERSRLPLMALFLLAPVFVDNQMLGMETPLLVLLLAGTVRAARRGRITTACLWYGPALITRPEAVLLSPFLLILVAAEHGWGPGMKRLLQPKPLACLLTPGVLWVIFAVTNYGSLIPQSMVAKTGWGSTHYDSIFTLQNAILTVPRLSFLPFIDGFPRATQWVLGGVLLLGVLWVLIANLANGTRSSRTWLGFYVVYITFFLVGKGATEASWYAVPSSVALLCAAAPCLPRWLTATRPLRTPLVLILGLGGLSVVAAAQRAPLLKYYVDGYGACADFLEARAQPDTAKDTKVAIGEIGVFGFRTTMKVVDVAALVSPETLPWRNEGLSFIRMVQLSGSKYFVISDKAVTTNTYPAIAAVWIGDEEKAWFDGRCKKIAQFKDKHVYEVMDERAQ